MKDLFKENGSLTEEGERFIIDFQYGLSQIMESDEVQEMSDDQLRTLQSNLMKMIGRVFTIKMSRNLQFLNDLFTLTDEQFYAHLKDKYGDNWIFHSLEKEERERIPLPDLQKIADESKYIGETIIKHMANNGVRFNK
jgi:hypothetical protein